MTLAITNELNAARLSGTLDFLDSGAGNAEIRIYGGTRPATPSDVPGSGMLVAIPLTKPAGSVGAGGLTLTPSDNGQVANSGDATWARVVSGSGATAFDADVSDTAGTGDIKITNVTLWVGGFVALVSAILR